MIPLPSLRSLSPLSLPSPSKILISCHPRNPLLNPNGNIMSNGIKIPQCVQNILLRSVAGVLAFALVSSPPLPAEAVAFTTKLFDPPPSELCREESEVIEEEKPSESITNEELAEEAWEVVNDSYIGDLGNRHWSPEIWKQRKEYFVNGNIKTRSRAHDVIQKMLASLGDPYTRFISPAEFSKLARYDISGIGINLREIPDDNGSVKLKVLGIILDGPAHSAGVRQGDEILSVNGIEVKGKSAFDISTMLQGPKETFVTIEVKHGTCGPTQTIKVQRQPVARTPVFYRLEKMENGNVSVGYIHIKEFNALATKDLIIALRRLQESGASYFVLDLKDNLGGLVQTGIEVAKLFLTKGETVIYTMGRDPQIQKSIVAETAPLITSPVIVLVNNRTASASEIVASALHDNCKAVLVGERTFGKGLIQSVFELHDGSGVVVTIGKYVTPNHKNINGNGIEPDFLRFPALREVVVVEVQISKVLPAPPSCKSIGMTYCKKGKEHAGDLLPTSKFTFIGNVQMKTTRKMKSLKETPGMKLPPGDKYRALILPLVVAVLFN